MPNIIRTPQDYASRTMHSKVKEAAQFVGEEMIGLVMYRVGVDDKTQPRCGCYNRIYEQTQEFGCPYCYGTTFAGGVKEAWRFWGIVNDDKNFSVEHSKEQGLYIPHKYYVQVEPWPSFTERDFLVRVQDWDQRTHKPIHLAERYVLTNVERHAIRTGNRYGLANQDQVAQSLQINVLPDTHPIYKYNIPEDEPVSRWDGQPR